MRSLVSMLGAFCKSAQFINRAAHFINSLSLKNKQNAQNCKFEYRTHPLAEKWLNLTALDHAYCIVRLLVTILPFTNNRRVVINNTKVYLVTFSKKKKKKKRVHQSLHESYIKVPATYCS